MNESERNAHSDSRHDQPDAPSSAAAADSASRRRALLRHLSLGATVTAAGAPMRALAGYGGDKKHCFHKDDWKKTKCHATVSGCHSPISSLYDRDVPESPGKHCTYYRDRTKWPKDWQGYSYCKGWNNQPFRRDATFKELFNCSGGGYRDMTLRDIMNNQYDCDEKHWITACLNATLFGTQFSYEPYQVVQMYHDPFKRPAALYFFKNFQENYYS